MITKSYAHAKSYVSFEEYNWIILMKTINTLVMPIVTP